MKSNRLTESPLPVTQESPASGLSRRAFLSGTAAALAAASCGLGRTTTPLSAATDGGAGSGSRPSATHLEGGAPAPPDPAGNAQQHARRTARVVLIRDAGALDEQGQPRPAVIRDMLDQGLTALLGAPEPRTAWQRIAGPTDRVGIKTNVWRFLPTPAAVEEAIRDGLLRAGVPPQQIAITDREARTLLADRTVLVNARPLRTHHWAGIGGCIKNMIMFTEDPAALHPEMCADLARVWELPAIAGQDGPGAPEPGRQQATAGRVRLNILVALTPQFFTRGPHHFDPRYVWPYGGLFLSQDPVAVDALGVQLLEAQRRAYFGEERSLRELARHVRLADERHGLGVADPARIELVQLGWQERSLL